jgi:hypothetical protein
MTSALSEKPARFDWTLILTALLIECGVLAANRGRCPLTNLAARFTSTAATALTFTCPDGWRAEIRSFSGHFLFSMSCLCCGNGSIERDFYIY